MYLSRWFKTLFNFNANFIKAIMVPCNKFKEANWYKYFEYQIKLDFVSTHNKYNFLNEKHIWNHNGNDIHVRRDLATGQILYIKVSSNFQDSQSIRAYISTSKEKKNKIFYTIGQENNNLILFMTFIWLIASEQFLRHNKILVMDNYAIYHKRISVEL